MSPVTGALSLQARLAAQFSHKSDIDISGPEIHLPEDAFTFITVPDHTRALAPLAAARSPKSPEDQLALIDALAPAYDRFVIDVLETIRKSGGGSSVSSSGGTTGGLSVGAPRRTLICALDPAELAEGVRAETASSFVVSLNEGDSWANFRLGLSRLFSVGGDHFFSHTSRPGSAALDEQLRELKVLLKDAKLDSVALVDDHAFSGKTIENVITLLAQQGIKVQRVVTHTKVGSLDAISRGGIEVRPVKSFTGEKLLSRADLVEPRYFLIGSTGCVVELPNNQLARAPYVLPFASPTARASIPVHEQAPFSRRVLGLNRTFFREWERVLGSSPRVADLDPFFQRLAMFHGFGPAVPVQELLDACSERLEDKANRRAKLEHAQQKLRPLGLPHDIVFLDINDTVLRSGDSEINLLAKEQFTRRIRRLQNIGVHVGLCSDSPLPQMRAFAEKFGIKGPIIAENGNIIHHNGHTTTLRPFEGMEGFRTEIKNVASAQQLSRANDRVAVEFGGPSTSIEAGTYCFGEGRTTSISVFGDAPLIEALREKFNDRAGIIGVDANTNAGRYGFFALHPVPLAQGKAETLRMLAQFGLKVTMVGNSPSDYLDPSDGVDIGMVGNHSLPPEHFGTCRFRTTINYTFGVCDILRQIEVAREKEGARDS